ncbi:hypothetical protein MNBD_ALPHA11-921, partial [hydrothermal vent metagenome]
HNQIVVFREVGRLSAGRLAASKLAASKLAASPLETKEKLLQPGQKILWDQRFVVKNTSKNPVIVKSALTLNRQQLQDHVAGVDHLKMDWVHSCVMVVDKEENLLAIGTNSLDKSIICELVNFSWR